MRDRRQGLTDEDFTKLAKERDEMLEKTISAIAKSHGWDRAKTHAHISPGGNSHQCYCACPDGPCQHDWSGPGQDILDDNGQPCGFETTCARCGMGAMSHDVRVMP